MKKVLCSLTVILASILLLSACSGNSENAKHSRSNTSENRESSIHKIRRNVDALFSDSSHTKLAGDVEMSQIKQLEHKVSKLKSSKTKTRFKNDIKKALGLWPEFKKQKDAQNADLAAKAASVSESNKAVSISESIVAESETKAASESSAKAASESTQAAENAKTDEQKTADRLEKDVLFGYLDKSKVTKGLGSYYQSDDFDYAHFGTGEHNIIKSVKLDFKDTPLLDKEEAIEYVQSFTADDATKVSERDEESDYFHSDKTGLNYLVKYSTNDDGIYLILILPEQ